MPLLHLEILYGSRHLPSFTTAEVATANPFSIVFCFEFILPFE